MTTREVEARFESDARGLIEESLVLSATIEERTSALYAAEVRFDVEQELPFGKHDAATILSSPCRLRIASGSVERIVHGIAHTFELLGPTEGGRFAYRVVIAPRIWRLGCTIRSRVFQSMSAPAIVRRVLLDAGLREGVDFELRLRRGARAEPDDLPEPGPSDDDFADYPQREYTVQLEESDLAFVQRLLEHEGISFFFDQDERDRLVLADENVSFDDAGELTFDASVARDNDGHIVAISRAHRTVPAALTLRDYNWRTPRVAVIGEAEIDDTFGTGSVASYGDHAKTPRDAARYARARAQRIAEAHERFTMKTTSTRPFAGARFLVSGAYAGELDQRYLTVASRAFITREGSAWTYRAELEAIDERAPHRPERVTLRPRIHGLLHARIDGVQIGKAAPIDALGRYKVLLPWDPYAQPGGRASRWIRMAQPHAGDGYGIHFPLHIGTEVLLGHVGGDPDRPVIVAAVPNPDTISPVTNANATQNVLRSRSGVHIELEDDAR
jgi:type VI secretion system secreted protein VgrG